MLLAADIIVSCIAILLIFCVPILIIMDEIMSWHWDKQRKREYWFESRVMDMLENYQPKS